jgi:hypothetical protein
VREHVCTRRCLRWTTDYGRRFSYCAHTGHPLTKQEEVDMKNRNAVRRRIRDEQERRKS